MSYTIQIADENAGKVADAFGITESRDTELVLAFKRAVRERGSTKAAVHLQIAGQIAKSDDEFALLCYRVGQLSMIAYSKEISHGG